MLQKSQGQPPGMVLKPYMYIHIMAYNYHINWCMFFFPTKTPTKQILAALITNKIAWTVPSSSTLESFPPEEEAQGQGHWT